MASGNDPGNDNSSSLKDSSLDIRNATNSDMERQDKWNIDEHYIQKRYMNDTSDEMNSSNSQDDGKNSMCNASSRSEKFSEKRYKREFFQSQVFTPHGHF